jgi:hypothetical protein
VSNNLKEQFAIWDGFFKDRDGNSSPSRSLLVLYGVGAFVLWAIASLRNATLQEIPDSVLTIFGVLISGKTLQGK